MDNFDKGFSVFFVIGAVTSVATTVAIIWGIVTLVKHFTQ